MRGDQFMVGSTVMRRGFAAGLSVIAVGAVVGLSGRAQAATPTPPAPASDNTTGHVTVNSTLSIDVNPPDFYLDGAPGITDTDSITVTVTTNNVAGYTLNLSAPSTLIHTNTTDNIPITDLKLDPATGTFTALTAGTQSAPVGSSTGATPITGTPKVHNFQVTIPSVPSGEYTGVLTYTATANP
jgi:hypothetical protein